MEACVEALFQIEGESGKRKTIQMIKVLKGAISVSKSRTGEVIYQYNRHEKKGLQRDLNKYDRDKRRSRLDIEHQKSEMLRKWSLVFGRQRNFSESIKGFDDMLSEAILLRERLQGTRVDSDSEDEEEAELTPEQKAALAEEEKRKLLASVQDPRQRRALLIKLNNQQQQAAQAADGAAGTVLPKINMGQGLIGGKRDEDIAEEIEMSFTDREEQARRRAQEEAEERKRKARELPRFDRALVKDYLKEQRHLHDDLLTRNALLKIKKQADHDHLFFKYRMKTNLPCSAQTLLQQLETDRPCDPESRSMTRASTRSMDDTVRPSTRATTSGASQTGRNSQMRRSLQGLRRMSTRHSTKSNKLPGRFSLEREDSIAASEGNGRNSKDERLGLGDRAKTVHFS